MRLLNSSTLSFEEFFDTEPPPYAILSHRWGPYETTYHDIYRNMSKEHPALPNPLPRSLQKVVEFCRFAQAQQPPHEWVWIDTCCIDKKDNTAELVEAINSMYFWYERAEVCYVLLNDVSGQGLLQDEEKREAFRQSKWFTRGWTLQELLAPPHVVFCDLKWDCIGTRSELAQDISNVTGIAKPFLDGSSRPREASVAMRMSWASGRQTTRVEDRAYCLLGLFDITLQLMYGEKMRAFLRLQEELIANSDDESLFAWRANKSQWGMLAESPDAFRDSGNIVSVQDSPFERYPYRMTNKGLEIRSPDPNYTGEFGSHDAGDAYFGGLGGLPSWTLELDCFIAKGPHVKGYMNFQDADHSRVTIKLKRFGIAWSRVECDSLGLVSLPRLPTNFNEREAYTNGSKHRVYLVRQPRFRT